MSTSRSGSAPPADPAVRPAREVATEAILALAGVSRDVSINRLTAAIEADRATRDRLHAEEREIAVKALESIRDGNYTVIMEWSQEQLQREIATIKAIAAKALARLTAGESRGTNDGK